ncbi:UBX7 UBX domain-containing protein 7 [Candida maltosa Xu316]
MINPIDNYFTSSVQQAVATTIQQQKSLFVFLTTGENEQTSEFLDRFIDQDMVDTLNSNFVLLKLIKDTQDFSYFNLVVPSFYIVNSGKVEVIISDETTTEEFKNAIDKLVHTNKPQTNNTQHDQPRESTGTQSPTPVVQQPQPKPQPPKQQQQQEQQQNNNAKPPLSEHEISVQKHKKEVERLRKEKLAEKRRLRELLRADQRERELRAKQELSPAAEDHHTEKSFSSRRASSTSSDACALAIKLFDGSTIKQEFKAQDTLLDVRTWLESQVEIIPPVTSMPSFATSAYTLPTGYVFHCPALPRITFSEEQESNSLETLHLTPRSALILKPTYDEPDSDNANSPGERSGIFRSIFSGIGKVAGAVLSVFDYSSGAPYNREAEERLLDGESDNEDLRHPSEPHAPLNLAPPGVAGPPPGLLFDERSASSLLLNIEPNDAHFAPRPRTPHAHSEPYIGQHAFVPSNLSSRSSTPRPPSVQRVQTMHAESSDTAANKEKKQKIDTYNGNSINLKEAGDDDDDEDGNKNKK